MMWLVGFMLAVMVAGCGGSSGVLEGSPRLAPGSYSGAEDWRTGPAAGTTIPLVAVVTAGNNLVYSDIGAPGGLPYNGTAILPLAVDSEGRFSAQVARGTFESGFIPAGVVSGVNRPDALPQLAGTIRLDTGDEASWHLTRQGAQAHPAEGLYLGNFSGPESGPVVLVVGPDGLAILVRGPAGRWAETAVGSADADTGALTFGQVNPGTVLGGAISGDQASGSYTFGDVGSGTWSATRQ